MVDAAWQEDTTGYEWNDATQQWEVAGDWDAAISQQPEYSAMLATGATGTSFGGASGYDASADGQQGGMLETGYFGEDGMWYDEAEEAAAATAAAAGASGYDQGGGYDEQQAAGGYYGDDGVWYQTEQHGQEAGAESEQAGYYGDDGQWYLYEEGAADEQGYYGDDGQWYSYYDGGGADATAAAADGADGAGEYDDQQQQGYYDENGQWVSYYDEQGGEGYYQEGAEQGDAAADHDEGGYYDDQQPYVEGTQQAEEPQAQVAGGPGYVVVTVLHFKGLRKVRP